MFRGMVFVFSSPSSTWWSPASLGLTEHLPIHGKQWIISCLAWLCSWLLLYLLSVFISTQEFPHFYSSVSLLSPTMRWVNEQLIDSSCWLGLNHNTHQLWDLKSPRSSSSLPKFSVTWIKAKPSSSLLLLHYGLPTEWLHHSQVWTMQRLMF